MPIFHFEKSFEKKTWQTCPTQSQRRFVARKTCPKQRLLDVKKHVHSPKKEKTE